MCVYFYKCLSCSHDALHGNIVYHLDPMPLTKRTKKQKQQTTCIYIYIYICIYIYVYMCAIFKTKTCQAVEPI